MRYIVFLWTALELLMAILHLKMIFTDKYRE